MQRQKRCPNGFRRNKKTGECEPVKRKLSNVKNVNSHVSPKDGKIIEIIDPLLTYLNDRNKLQLLSTVKHNIPMNNIRKRIRNELFKKPVTDVLDKTYLKMSKIPMQKPRFTYQEMLYVFLIHNLGPQTFDNIVGDWFGKKSMIVTLSECLENGTITQVKVPGVKAQYKGHQYKMSYNYDNYVIPNLINITSNKLYKEVYDNRYNPR